MKYILFILLFFTLCFAETILIPEDYSTIQQGIDASQDGDTVLVADGDYIENLVLNKSIVLASNAIFDDFTDWVTYDNMFMQWVITNSHIENTRLIGSDPENVNYSSVMIIAPEFGNCITPEVMGFTFMGGNGTLVSRVNGQGVPEQIRLGGGILADISDPLVHYNKFKENGSSQLYSGGAMQLTSYAEDWDFNDRFINHRPRCSVNEFRVSHNLYDNNDAQIGNSIANKYHEDSFDMSGSIFDVFNCSGDEGDEISAVWVKVESDANVNYNESQGNLCAFTSADVYVDPNIDQECFEDNCGSISDPFQTINRALEMISPSQSNPITINLAEGVYTQNNTTQISPGDNCYEPTGNGFCPQSATDCFYDCNYFCLGGYQSGVDGFYYDMIGDWDCDEGSIGSASIINFDCAEFACDYGDCGNDCYDDGGDDGGDDCDCPDGTYWDGSNCYVITYDRIIYCKSGCICWG